MIQQLTKQSTAQEIKAYFEEVLKLSKDSKEFPVNLDDVWPLVYSRKDKAVRALKEGESFFEGIDYQPLPPNGERLEGNSPFIEAVGILEGKEALQDRPLLP